MLTILDLKGANVEQLDRVSQRHGEQAQAPPVAPAQGMLDAARHGLGDARLQRRLLQRRAQATPASVQLTAQANTQEPVLRTGSTGSAVIDLQQRLNQRGATLATDGSFGPNTHAAVLHFQQQQGLTPDGVVGRRTWAALKQAGNTPPPVPVGPPSSVPPGPPTPPPAHGPPGMVAKLHMLVDLEAKEISVDALKRGLVGHTWISLEYPDPAQVPTAIHAQHRPLLMAGGRYADPMGFWPLKWVDDQGVTQGGYSTNPFASYVPGLMRHPDRMHQGMEKARESWDLSQKEVDAVIDYAESKRGAQYSVYFYNCSTFAKEAVEAAGKSPPSMGTGVNYPNAAYDGIKKRQQQQIGQTEVKDYDTGAVRTENHPEGGKR